MVQAVVGVGLHRGQDVERGGGHVVVPGEVPEQVGAVFGEPADVVTQSREVHGEVGGPEVRGRGARRGLPPRRG